MANPIQTAPRRTFGRLMLVSVLALGGAAACTWPTADVTTFSAAQSPKVNKVERITWPATVVFAPSQAGVGVDQVNRLEEAMLVAGGPESLHATVTVGSDGRGEAVASELVAMGVDPANIHIMDAPATRTPSGMDRVDVVLSRYVVTPPSCPDWSQQLGKVESQGHASNFGCSTVTNLGMMVADPRDLVAGRALGPSDGTREAAAVQRYREDKVKELDASSTDTLNIQ